MTHFSKLATSHRWLTSRLEPCTKDDDDDDDYDAGSEKILHLQDADERANINVNANTNGNNTETEDDTPLLLQSLDPMKVAMSRLLLAESIIRDITSTDKDYDVIILSGYKVNQLMKQLQSTSKFYQVITLMVGTNDCGSDAHINTILDDYQTLLDVTKDRAHMVHVSGLCPRMDDDLAFERVILLKSGLEELCKKY